MGISRLSDAKKREDRWDMLNQDAELLLPAQTAIDMFFEVPRQAVQGVAAAVMVDREPNVDGVVERIKGMGVSAFAFREGLKRERLMYSLIFRSMTCIAAVALLVAAPRHRQHHADERAGTNARDRHYESRGRGKWPTAGDLSHRGSDYRFCRGRRGFVLALGASHFPAICGYVRWSRGT